MGKAILFLIAGTGIASVLAYGNLRMGSVESSRQTADYEHAVLAREIANSAFNVSFADAETVFGDIAAAVRAEAARFQGGDYDIDTRNMAPHIVEVDVVGRSGPKEHRIEGVLMLDAPIESAVLIDAPQVVPSFVGTNFEITGRDTPPPSSTVGELPWSITKGGIRTRTGDIGGTLKGALGKATRGRVNGADGDEDIAPSKTDVAPAALAASARERATDVVPAGVLSGTHAYGTGATPSIVHVPGDLTVAGTLAGRGVLLVDGNLDVSAGTLEWEGLVIAHKESELVVNYGGNSTVHGAMLLSQATCGAPAEPEAPELRHNLPFDPTGMTFAEAVTRVVSDKKSMPKKVTICHYPPGHGGAKGNTLSVSVNAVATHVGHHGDHVGECFPEAGAEPGAGGAEAGGGSCTPLAFTIGGDAKVIYSTEAIASARRLVPEIEAQSKVKVMAREESAAKNVKDARDKDKDEDDRDEDDDRDDDRDEVDDRDDDRDGDDD